MKETPIYFEWGHGDLLTSIYKVDSLEVSDDRVLVKLFVPPTVCKPRELVEVANEKMVNLAGADSSGCCGPSSKCC